ncbi:MAG: prevent-host-death protein [Cyclobacteriaceae bacterium]
METYNVGEFKARFSEMIEKVKAGQSVGVTYGKKKELIGVFESQKPTKKKRTLGLLKGKVSYKFKDDFKFQSEEEFLGER